MGRNVHLAVDPDGNQIVVIEDILFKGKRNIFWHDVEDYLKRYIGKSYSVTKTGEMVFIGSDLPDEYANSNYTRILKGANAKAKANAAQGLPETEKYIYTMS